MNKQAYGSRMQIAVETIAQKTGVDVSRSALPKAPRIDILRLFQLEKLARELPNLAEVDGVDPEEIRRQARVDFLEKIGDVKGIGPSTVARLREELADLL